MKDFIFSTVQKFYSQYVQKLINIRWIEEERQLRRKTVNSRKIQ